MKLSAQITDTVKFSLIMIIFSFVVFIGYSFEKRIIDNIRGGKGSQKISYLPVNLYSSANDVHYRV